MILLLYFIVVVAVGMLLSSAGILVELMKVRAFRHGGQLLLV